MTLVVINIFILFLCNFAGAQTSFNLKIKIIFESEVNVTGGGSGDAARDDLPEISKHVIAAAIEAQEFYKKKFEDNQRIGESVSLDNRTAGLLRFMGPVLPDFLIIDHYSSKIISKTLEILIKTDCARCNREKRKIFIKKLLKRKFVLHGVCKKEDDPDPNRQKGGKSEILKYRTLDGSFNNLKHPNRGKDFQAMPRFLPPDYCNGADSPKCAKSGNQLPNPRKLSIFALYQKSTAIDRRFNMMAAELAQLLSHDLSAQVNDNDLKTANTSIACCKADQSEALPHHLLHDSCIPIQVGFEDVFYSTHGIGCLQFVRSLATPDPNCYLSYREQINVVSAYIDMNVVYGTGDKATGLRKSESGKLVVGPRHRMPPGCGEKLENYCYNSGDPQTNQQIYIASIQTIFFKNHNYICDKLEEVHFDWSEEKLYQEARRLNIAQYQHIFYQELLPLLIGKSRVEDMFESLNEDGFTSCYDENVNGATHNEFTVAYRTMHTTLPNTFNFVNETGHTTKKKIGAILGNVTSLEATCGGYDNVLRGMMNQHMMKYDRYMNQEISHQWLLSGNPYGHDLITTDIQRERDLGVPSYNAFREFCGLPKFKSFEDIDSMDQAKVGLLRLNFYESVDDIDMYVGGLFEDPAPGSIFGPVITCILKEQFQRSMCGDRFFYTNSVQDYPFTKGQLEEITNHTTMASLICLHSDKIQKVPKNAFQVESLLNPLVNCTEIPIMSFKPWEIAD